MLPTLDLSVLQKLHAYRSPTKPHLVRTLIELYLEQSPHLLRDMQYALMIGDDLTLFDAACRLHVDSLILGGMQLNFLCEQFKQCREQHDVANMTRLLGQMGREYASFAEALQQTDYCREAVQRTSRHQAGEWSHRLT